MDNQQEETGKIIEYKYNWNAVILSIMIWFLLYGLLALLFIIIFSNSNYISYENFGSNVVIGLPIAAAFVIYVVIENKIISYQSIAWAGVIIVVLLASVISYLYEEIYSARVDANLYRTFSNLVVSDYDKCMGK